MALVWMLAYSLIAAVAGATLVRAWLLPDGIFSGWRDAIQVWANQRPVESRFDWRGTLGELAECRFCLLVWVPLALLTVLLVSQTAPSPYREIVHVPIFALAAARLAHFIEGVDAET